MEDREAKVLGGGTVARHDSETGRLFIGGMFVSCGKGLFFGRAGWVADWVADWCLCCRCHRAVYHGLRSSVGLGPGGLWVY